MKCAHSSLRPFWDHTLLIKANTYLNKVFVMRYQLDVWLGLRLRFFVSDKAWWCPSIFIFKQLLPIKMNFIGMAWRVWKCILKLNLISFTKVCCVIKLWFGFYFIWLHKLFVSPYVGGMIDRKITYFTEIRCWLNGT